MCLIGPPNSRKSTTIKGGITDDGDEIKGLIPTMHYYDVSTDARYPFDGYNGERFIIYDDVTPESRDQLISLCDPHLKEHPAPGAQRYGMRMIPAKQLNVVIIICNPSAYDFKLRAMLSDPAMSVRFKIYRYSP